MVKNAASYLSLQWSVLVELNNSHAAHNNCLTPLAEKKRCVRPVLLLSALGPTLVPVVQYNNI